MNAPIRPLAIPTTSPGDLPDEPEPSWDVALLFPRQGQWTEEEYLALDTNRPVEFVDGRIEVLPMPTLDHQWISLFLYEALKVWAATGDLGRVVVAAYKVRLRTGRFREPDVIFIRRENAALWGRQFAKGADLVMEVVSEDDPSRDLEVKRKEYAGVGIPEYWIIDPRVRTITVLALDGTGGEGAAYAVHGVFATGQSATSRLLPGFAVDVAAAFAAGEMPAEDADSPVA